MTKRFLGTLHTVFGDIHNSAWPILITSILYRVIAFVILTPLVSGLAWLFLNGSGRVVVSNEEIASFFMEPVGLAAFIVMTSVVLTLFALEQACLMTLVFGAKRKAVPMAIKALKYVLFRGIRILELAGRIVLKTIIIAIPFLALAVLIYILFLTEHDINYYLKEQPPVFIWSRAGGVLLGIGLFASLLIFAMRVLFALPVLLFESRSPKASIKKSADLSRGNRLRIAVTMCVWGIIIFTAVSIAGGFFIFLGKLLAPLLIGYTAVLVFVLGVLFLGFSLTQLLVNIFATASFSIVVMYLYNRMDPSHAPSETMSMREDGHGKHGQTAFSGRVIIIGTALLVFIAGITGWLLLSDVELKDRTEVIAHRGSSNAAPENTLAAVDQAIADGAHWTEIDVQRTMDDRVVVVHDKDLMKIGGKPIVVNKASYSELAGVDVGSWFDPVFADQRITTLDALLDHCRGRINVNIELKYYGWDEQLAHRVIKIVEDTQMVDNVVIMSLQIKAVDQVKALRPIWKTGLLTTVSLGNLTRTNADFLAVHSRMVTPGFVSRVHKAGKDVMVWTVNDTVGMTKYFSMNVDGLITDEPALAMELLEQRAGMDPIEKALISLGLLVVGATEHVDPMTDGF